MGPLGFSNLADKCVSSSLVGTGSPVTLETRDRETKPVENGVKVYSKPDNQNKVKVKKKVKRLDKKKWEDLMAQKIKKYIEGQKESELINLKKSYKDLQEEVKLWKEKTAEISKAYQDLAKQYKIKEEVKSKGEEQYSGENKSENSKSTEVLPTPKAPPISPVPPVSKEVINNGLSEDGLPSLPARVTSNDLLPIPTLKLTQTSAGLEVFWTHTEDYTSVSSYELYAFRKNAKSPPNATWMKVGDVPSIPLPIRCTLSSFKSGCTYNFIVRSKDSQGRLGEFSGPKVISLV